MRMVVLGGTRFLGRALVEAALARGHEVTLFTRGETNPDLFPEAEHLHGDREHDLAPLRGHEWDAAVDTSGYVPHVVRAGADLLADSVGHYTFVSTISVYDLSRANDESAPTVQLDDLPVDRLLEDYSNYGPLKVLCEQEVRDVFGARALVVRPGLIVGPHDPTGRFTYWPHRFARGGDVLVPAPPERRIQFIDVRDLAEWTLELVECRDPGTYNATHPGRTWRELVDACLEVAPEGTRPVWIEDEVLREHDVGEWMELPLWIEDPDTVGLHMADVSKALAAGLRLRPLVETVRATLEEAEPTDDAGLRPDREVKMLAE